MRASFDSQRSTRISVGRIVAELVALGLIRTLTDSFGSSGRFGIGKSYSETLNRLKIPSQSSEISSLFAYYLKIDHFSPWKSYFEAKSRHFMHLLRIWPADLVFL